MELLRQWETAQHDSRRQEDFLLSVQRAARPKRRILLDHGPDFSLDLVVNGGIENNHPAQDSRTACWKIRANRGLNVARPDAFRGCKGRREDRVAQAIRWSSRRQRTSEKQSHKIVALPLRCGKRPELHLPREVSESIRDARLMRKVTRRKDSHFQTCHRNDFQAAGGTIVRGYRSASGVSLSRNVEAVLLDQHDVCCDKGRNKMRLARTSLGYPKHPGTLPVALVAAIVGVGIVLVRIARMSYSGRRWRALVRRLAAC